MTRIVIVGAKRTAQGRLLGALAKRTAAELGVAAAKAALGSIPAAAVDQVIVGNVVSAGLGQNVARQVGIGAGVPKEVPAYAVNMMCASGLQAVALAAQAIRAGDARVVLCGGTESMSNAPYLLDRARAGYKYGDATLVDSLLRDGLVDAFDHEPMGMGAEDLAAKFGITRPAQDAFALRSQQRWAQAQQRGAFADEIVALDGLDRDEHARPDTTLEKLATLKPAFKPGGTVTAGNASGINDGAAMLVLCDEATAKKEGWRPLAVFESAAAAGVEPRMFGIGPVAATRRLCGATNIKIDAFDTIELNEAFAAQALSVMQELALDEGRVNPDGGAIALGHPIGASGARLAVHLAHRIARGESKRSLATLCVGGGMGIAAAIGAV
ncbi:MAG: acetyl-CoA C-acyltransferase [Planctomycetota bacterium]|nr:acetyl-CoA C-acyltransferase [Planctomycetota bacterium]